MVWCKNRLSVLRPTKHSRSGNYRHSVSQPGLQRNPSQDSRDWQLSSIIVWKQPGLTCLEKQRPALSNMKYFKTKTKTFPERWYQLAWYFTLKNLTIIREWSINKEINCVSRLVSPHQSYYGLRNCSAETESGRVMVGLLDNYMGLQIYCCKNRLAVLRPTNRRRGLTGPGTLSVQYKVILTTPPIKIFLNSSLCVEEISNNIYF